MGMSLPKSKFWWQLVFSSSQDIEESIFWKLESIGINHVAVQFSPEDPQQRTFFVWLLSFEWSRSDRENLINSLKPLADYFDVSISKVTWQKVEDEDWSKSWKRVWQADPVGENLLILPAWLEVPQEYSHRLILRLDPGSAFGTGSHPTTRLCLEALEINPPLNLRVADIGCGSGVLSLAALGLGASEVIGVDIDSSAVRASIDNSKLNQIDATRFNFFLGSAEVLIAQLQGKLVDLILCNTLAPVLEELAPNFDDFLLPNGRAFLSGLLIDQAPELAKLFEDLGWHVISCVKKDNWGLLEIQRPEIGEKT